MISKLKSLFAGKENTSSKNSDELFEEGKSYHLGLGVNQNLVKAARLYQLSTQMGNMKAKHNLALMYIMQEGGLADKELGVQMLEELSLAGDIHSKFNLGKLLLEGELLPKDSYRGIQLLEEASSQGFGAASYQLGAYYTNELKDNRKGIEYLKLAASQDNALANSMLAQIYEQGLGTEIDFELSFKYLQRAAELDDPLSQLKWGIISVEIMHNFNIGIGWVRKAMKNGVNGAFEYLDSLGLANEMSDEERVEHFFEDIVVPVELQTKERLDFAQNKFDQMSKCCAYGDPVAQYVIGTLLHLGICLEKDDQAALQQLKLSVENGCVEAYGMLGMVLQQLGQSDEALKYLQLGAENGNKEAIHNLGNAYYYARGVEQDVEKAIQLWSQSAQMGNPDSLRTLGNCYLQGVGFEQDIDKAIELFTQSANMGLSLSIDDLIELYKKLGNRAQIEYWQRRKANL